MKIFIYYNEVWKSIYINKEKSRYLISNKGRVKNSINGKILKQAFTEKGYLHVSLRHNGKAYSRRVHRLVAKAFLKRTLCKKDVNHLDGRKTNNYDTNLEWTNPSKNQLHAYQLGLRIPQCGEDRYNNVNSENLVIAICECLEEGLSTKEIKGYLNIQGRNFTYLIYDIKRKNSWTYISKNYNF